MLLTFCEEELEANSEMISMPMLLDSFFFSLLFSSIILVLVFY